MEQEVRLYGKLNRRRYTVSRDQLDEAIPALNLEEIEAKSTSPTEDGARVAANITLRWPGTEEEEEGEELFLEALNEGESALVTQGFRVRLEKRPDSWLWGTWWLLLLILLALLIWFGVFGYLYYTM